MNHSYFAFLALSLAACSSSIDVGKNQGDGGSGSNPGPANAKRMFVTRAAYTGNLATLGGGQNTGPLNDPGADGADRLCTAAATAANLGGNWKAWITSCTPVQNGPCTEVHDAIERIADVPGGWYNLDRSVQLFSNRANLATLPLDNTWNGGHLLDEYGNAPPTDPRLSEVWTGTGIGGHLATGDGINRAAEATCNGWTEPQTGDYKGIFGLAASDPNQWTNDTLEECQHSSHLYCLEQ